MESNLWQAVNKTSNEKKIIIQKQQYILELLLNVVTTRTEALIVSGIKFLYACVKKFATCELSHVLTSSINSSLLFKPYDHNRLFRQYSEQEHGCKEGGQTTPS
jgi:hypothetical protein